VNVGSGVGVGRTKVGEGSGVGDSPVDPPGVDVGTLEVPGVGVADAPGSRPGMTRIAATSATRMMARDAATVGEPRDRLEGGAAGCGSAGRRSFMATV
jgi:hypothetical protein